MPTEISPIITIRAMRDDDLPATTAIRDLPNVRWGTLATPFESVERWRKFRAAGAPPAALLVACAGETIVGQAFLGRSTLARAAHTGSIGIMVHDDWQGKGVGDRLFAAIIDLADNWLGLRRLELAVYCDNPRAIALYEKYGFTIEATEVADAYRDGAFVDGYAMGRLRGDLPRDHSPYPAATTPALPGSFTMRAAEPADLDGLTELVNQPLARHGTLCTPFSTPQDNAHFTAPADPTARAIVAVADNVIVGFTMLAPMKSRRAHVGNIPVLVVHDAWQQRGIGTALLTAVIDIADNWLNLKRLTIGVATDNLAAIGLFQKHGFAREGTARAYMFRNGGFTDTLKMARVR